ncbi:pyroglutamyl-peptidase I [Nesterenkonia sp.]|uniref:pyroglutamyl-peptidase I family protein n=1 Tax=Nesterenkonia sp. TaxID=704201 RepID=UPI0026341A40|nr:pyroglutamyl-peptidase I [Nesterenkonia sp.]
MAPLPAERTILISAFEPFGALDYNPSADLAALLAHRAAHQQLLCQREHGPLQLRTVTLPVEFGRAGELLTSAVAEAQPAAVVALGLAAGTDAVRLERIGVNLRDARIPDNAGAQPVDQPIAEDGPAAWFSTLRLKAAHRRIAAAEIPVRLSLSAGTYLCNEVLYTLLHHLQRNGPAVPAGFVHVPDLRSPEAPVSLDQAAAAVDLLLTESLKPLPDESIPAGSLH